MFRMFTGFVAAAALSACATTSQSPPEQLVGTWNCTIMMSGMNGSSQLVYRPDGTAGGPVRFKGETEGTDVDVTGDVTSTWEFLTDGTLREVVTGFAIKTAAFDGEVLSADMISSLIQPMIASTLVGQVSTADVTFGNGTMTLSAEDAEPTRCSR